MVEAPDAVVVREWQGPTPYYLAIAPTYRSPFAAGIEIDLDEPQWATTHAEWMRRSDVVWFLMRKSHQVAILAVWVHPGDQPYYTARHVGITGSAGGNEITAYGIGKKRPDGTTHRMWVMPNGMVCAADDVDDLGLQFVRALGPK